MKKVMKDVLQKITKSYEKLYDLYNDLPFLPQKVENEKLVANLLDMNIWTCYTHKKFKAGLVFKKCIKSLNSVKRLA